VLSLVKRGYLMSLSSPPIATTDTAETVENTAVSINVLANDSSLNGALTLTGVTQGAHGTVAIASVTNSALSISSGQEINAGAVLAYDRNQPWTMMAELDVAQNPTQAAVIASNLVGSGSAHPGYQVFIDPSGHLQVRLVSNYSTGNDIDVQSSFVVTDGNWHDIAVSYDGSGSASGIKIYEDGKQDTATTVLANSLTGSIVSSTAAPLIIGNEAGYESSYDLHGALEQFSISDVVRSAAYIAQYSSPGSAAPVDANTALDYNFNHNTGSTIVDDLSSNGHNGTLSSSAMWTSGPSVPEVTYTPQTGYVGTDTFSYTESNGTGTATGQATVTVNPTVNSSPPVAAAETAEMAENTAVSINVLANDSSSSGDGVTGLAVHAGATLELVSAVSGSVTFLSSTGTLKLDAPSTFTGQIIGFTGDGTLTGSDQIDLSNLIYNNTVQSQSSYNGSTGLLAVNNGKSSVDLSFFGDYSLANFKFATDGDGGTIVYDPPTSGQSSPLGEMVGDTIGHVSGTSSSILSMAANQDSFVFAPNFGRITVANSEQTNHISQSTFANVAVLLAANNNDEHGDTVAHAAHDIATQHITTTQLLAQQSDFHLYT
jgi:hypothetical protein